MLLVGCHQSHCTTSWSEFATNVMPILQGWQVEEIIISVLTGLNDFVFQELWHGMGTCCHLVVEIGSFFNVMLERLIQWRED